MRKSDHCDVSQMVALDKYMKVYNREQQTYFWVHKDNHYSSWTKPRALQDTDVLVRDEWIKFTIEDGKQLAQSQPPFTHPTYHPE